MKILFLSVHNDLMPHFETELELIYNHLEKGDDIYVLTCDGVFKYCNANDAHSFVKCFLCRMRFRVGIRQFKSSKIKILKIKKKHKLIDPNFIPKKFDTVEDLKKFELLGVDFGAAVACSLISKYRDHMLDTLAYKDVIFRSLKTAVFVYESVVNALQKIKPNIFYIYNGREEFDRPAVRASEKLGITFYTYDMSLTAYALCKNCTSHYLNEVKREVLYFWETSLLIDQEKKEIAREWFREARYGGFFTKNQQLGTLPKDFDFSKKNIAIFNSSLDELETFPEWRNTLYENEFDALLKIFTALKSETSMKFYLRIHPNLAKLDNGQMKDLRLLSTLGFKNLEIIWPEEAVDSYALMEACEKILVFYSTTGVEACYMDKPVILLGRTLYEDLGGCYIPKSHNEAITFIKKPLEPKKSDDILKYGFWVSQRRIPLKKFNKANMSFLGKRISVKWTLKNRVMLKLYENLDRICQKFRSLYK